MPLQLVQTDPRLAEARAALERAGFKPGKAWASTEAAVAAAREATTQENVAADLLTAVKNADVAEAARLAVVLMGDPQRARAQIDVAAEVALRESFPWPDAYTFAAKNYAAAADALTATITTVDPDTDAERAMRLPEDKRFAWLAATDHAAAVQVAYTTLLAVAKIAVPRFIPADPAWTFGLAVALDDAGLPMTGEPSDLLRIWTADRRADFGRAGRFGAMLKAGATLQAPALDKCHRLEIHDPGAETAARLEPQYDFGSADPISAGAGS